MMDGTTIDTPTTEGRAPFRHDGDELETWYKVVGDLGSGIPLVTLHGGPGFPHYYMLSLADLATSYGIPVVFYDQLGVGVSTNLPDKPPDFWTPDLFIEELENLLQHLDIHEFDLLGHSWGGMLAAQFAATRSPRGLRKLIISNSTASQSMWTKCLDDLTRALPDDVQTTLKRHEEAQSFTHQEYRDAINVFYARHMCRLPSLPHELIQTFSSIGPKSNVLFSMYGPSQLQPIGSLKDWTIIPDLHRIEVPTLVLNGRYDEAQDECVLPYFQHIPRVKWYTFAESSHNPHWEERSLYMRIVNDFLKG
ncbi:proline iminopeptidase protein [Schizopora paradoxa]|uniref:Proline iminopeptidase protein n=1 Tax=Schizopora paradoxa TaxID=27342 RepID=A0A0H2S4C6_9AGAM|nr:proline iminopeptidase protein [Schizopora paradoxa]